MAPALAYAASEGLTEFEPAIRQFAAELDRSPTARGSRRSLELLWYLRLSAGAGDENEARELALGRLKKMSDVEFREKMDSDTAFRQIVTSLAVRICQKHQPGTGCVELRSIYERQASYYFELRSSKEGKPVDTFRALRDQDRPPWLKSLYGWTVMRGKAEY